MNQPSNQNELLQLVKENEGIIYKICNSYCSNKSDREDLAQEILYQLFRSFKGTWQGYKFSTWMYRVSLNVAISFYRQIKSKGEIIHVAENEFEIEDNAGDNPELEKNVKTLQQFINALKELDKALVILYLEEKSHKEIAEIMGITETNVATRVSRIKEKLKQQFLKLDN